MVGFVPTLQICRPQQQIPSTEDGPAKTFAYVRCRPRPSLAPRIVCVQQKDAPSPKSSVSDLKQTLFNRLQGFNRGLDIDPDAETMTAEEADLEEVIEALEDNYPPQFPTEDPRLSGQWSLAYTSSAITRYFGGVTGLQRLLPNATVGDITQTIVGEDGTSTFEESVTFELPVIGNEVSLDIQVQGRLRATSEERQIWEPENVKCGFFSWFADNWKTFRAFQIADITYLDDELRITRGQTGNVAIFQKTAGGNRNDT
ncbi:PAP fibrillin [Gracilaria domingensis]|nr:PAP fibrillin [Gracilaria domingensis]